MDEKLKIRRAESPADGVKLKTLFNTVFHPEEVGVLAETIFARFPRMKHDYWFIVEDPESSAFVSAFALLPWVWEMEGERLKVAEMGIVGTLAEYRNKGLMKILNREFDQTLREDGFDLSVIQGIPGFYHKFGFHYAIPMDNHINLPLYVIPDELENTPYSFRLASADDIPYLLSEEEKYRRYYAISAYRDEENWQYLLGDSLKTEYGAEFWIAEHHEKDERYYVRILFHGFGKGLIISEASAHMRHEAAVAFLVFCKKLAGERGKPYIRLNLHNDSAFGKMAISMGAEKGKPYAWQIKIPDKANLLKKIAPVLERRMEKSCFSDFSETLRLDFFQSKIDLKWNRGHLESVLQGDDEDCANTFCINEDLFAPLCLGHRTWRELQSVRPDIFPAEQYVRPNVTTATNKTGLLVDTLFPSLVSWICEQY